MSFYPPGWWKLSLKRRWIISSVKSGLASDEADAIRQWDKRKKKMRELATKAKTKPKSKWVIISEEWAKVGEARYADRIILWRIIEGIINTDTSNSEWLSVGIEAGLNLLQQAERLKKAEISHEKRKQELIDYISAAIRKNDWNVFREIDEMFIFANTLKPHHLHRIF